MSTAYGNELQLLQFNSPIFPFTLGPTSLDWSSIFCETVKPDTTEKGRSFSFFFLAGCQLEQDKKYQSTQSRCHD